MIEGEGGPVHQFVIAKREVNGSDVNRALYTHRLMRLSAWALSAHCVQIASSRLEVDEDGII